MQENLSLEDDSFYQLLIKLERAYDRYVVCVRQIKELSRSYDYTESKIWDLAPKTIIRQGRCSDGRYVTAKYEYQEAVYKQEYAKILEGNLLTMKDHLQSDYALSYYQTQLSRLEIESTISEIRQETNEDVKHVQLIRAISSCFSFYRRLAFRDEHSNLPKSTPSNPSTPSLVKQWLTNLVSNIVIFAIAFHYF